MSVVPAGMKDVFRNAGWSEGRRVAVPPMIPADHPAHQILAELSGIVWIEPAKRIRSIEFKPIAQIDPSIAAWGEALGTMMVGIAEEDDGHAELYVTNQGQVLCSSQIHPACFLMGQTFTGAIEAIGRGDRARPLLLADQDEVTLYGQVFRRGDHEVLGPADLASF